MLARQTHDGRCRRGADESATIAKDGARGSGAIRADGEDYAFGSGAGAGSGGGIEIEVDTVRTGPFLVSVFTSTQAYRTLSGRKLRTTATGDFDDGVTPIDVSSRVYLDEWSFSGGVGVRLRWNPE